MYVYIIIHIFTLTCSYFYYTPLILSCVVVFAFPSGKSSSKYGHAGKSTLNAASRVLDSSKNKSE